ncbi:hypothetical protein GYMLUDRAFT_947922 [Collybiopsis luxurians FD-317 M1]|uniref:Uncharacterized protein n=1 Tax=Collybiopsis luxurians FD-317 M1 TaxID=944289 RepID=A0A0D0ARA1_9AGAR|nr:hypothetical protein GYMLUDRAFT_947922 [Collybiopsis luxurians FD-317 M1]
MTPEMNKKAYLRLLGLLALFPTDARPCSQTLQLPSSHSRLKLYIGFSSHSPFTIHSSQSSLSLFYYSDSTESLVTEREKEAQERAPLRVTSGLDAHRDFKLGVGRRCGKCEF